MTTTRTFSPLFASAFTLSLVVACSETAEPPEAAPSVATAALSSAESGPASKPTTVDESLLPTRVAPHPLAGVTSIVEATIESTWSEFDDRLGPRLFVKLSDLTVHAGRPPSKHTFSQLGGSLPDGRYVEVTELPELATGARYVLFFGRSASMYTAIWARLAFRLEQTKEKTIVLNPDGLPVLRFDADGIQYGQTSLLVESVEEPSDPKLAKVPGPAAFSLELAEASSEVKNAVSASQFVSGAVRATLKAGGPLGDEFTLEPPADVRWDVRPTSR
ncbi:MAG: hypothetical protein KIT72_16435 [Polyangiaceae bacterium]|nr:hypothetical protein [Polyangiaceae bacterium]MCW5792005.1 hypothetical protein [Polyangiaceae bacterium]